MGRRGECPVVLDIGCGRGIDHDRSLQASIAVRTGRFIGIEPDESVESSLYFDEFHRCTLEDAPLGKESIDVAFSVFGLEHVIHPRLFWKKVYDVLVPHGFFLALTVDARHYFCAMSRMMELLRIKGSYLNRLRGVRARERYANYPAYYRTNSPRRISRDTGSFRRREFISTSHPEDIRFYYPRFLWPAAIFAERLMSRANLPSLTLVAKLQK